jgi:GntR family transcriptional repressor for pyruvate dehydrogenase complex
LILQSWESISPDRLRVPHNTISPSGIKSFLLSELLFIEVSKGAFSSLVKYRIAEKSERRDHDMARSRKELGEKLMKIIRNQMEKGLDKLPSERELARELHVSRNLLREIIIVFEAKGILEVQERQGIFIRNKLLDVLDANLETLTIWPEEYIRHVMELRFLIEIPAAALAARRRKPEHLEKMRYCIENLGKVRFPDSEGEASIWDAYFHSCIVESSQNPLLSRIYENFSAFMKNFIAFRRKRLYAVNIDPQTILNEHKAILDAIFNQDEKAASSCMREHLSKNLEKYDNDENVQKHLSGIDIPFF